MLSRVRPLSRPSLLVLLVGLVLGVLPATAGPAAAFVDRDCGDFASQAAAQRFYLNHGGPQSDPHGLDADDDGIACDSNPCPCVGRGGGGNPAPPPVRRIASVVGLQALTTAAIPGEPVRMRAVVRPRGVRSVVLQRRTTGDWAALARARTTGKGTHLFRSRMPRVDADYRAVVLRVKRDRKVFLADTSPRRTVRAQSQVVTLRMPDVALAGSDVRARVAATPVRRGRGVELQRVVRGRWVAVEVGTLNRRGRASFTVRHPARPESLWRARVVPRNGAAAATSNRERVTSEDVTAPPVPTGLGATGRDAEVVLDWDDVAASDLVEYVVERAAAEGGPWAEVARPVPSTWTDSGLPNDVEVFYRVVAVDDAGNRSAPSAVVSATPTAPPIDPPTDPPAGP